MGCVCFPLFKPLWYFSTFCLGSVWWAGKRYDGCWYWINEEESIRIGLPARFLSYPLLPVLILLFLFNLFSFLLLVLSPHLLLFLSPLLLFILSPLLFINSPSLHPSSSSSLYVPFSLSLILSPYPSSFLPSFSSSFLLSIYTLCAITEY